VSSKVRILKNVLVRSGLYISYPPDAIGDGRSSWGEIHCTLLVIASFHPVLDTPLERRSDMVDLYLSGIGLFVAIIWSEISYCCAKCC
jgi:hypothetical protein